MKGRRWFATALVTGALAGIALLSSIQGQEASGGDPPPLARKGAAPRHHTSTEVKPDTSPIPIEAMPAPSLVDPLLEAVEAKYHGSAAYQWLNLGLEATAREHERHAPRPTIGSRNLAIIVTAMYDAWAAYDAKAVGTRLGGKLRRPRAERTNANKAKAIAYAVTRVLLDMYDEDAAWIKAEVHKRGVDPSDMTTNLSKPEGVGNTAAAALLAYRHHDGSNQLGDEVGSNGKPYSDWTYYTCKNQPGPAPMTDPNCWQPIPFDDGKGGQIIIGFLTPQWYRVKPFALERSDQFRPGPPPKIGSPQLKEEVDECLRLNAHLTPKQKAIVEFMRDGPKSTGQSGHWLTLAKAVSRRDKNGIDRDVKLFFTVGNVAFDAFIACWDAKRHYDSSRPWSLVRYYYKGKKVEGWGGPGKGVIQLPAEEWHPYSPFVFVTPPFPGYPSGHSTVSGASAKMLELFTGSDKFGEIEKRKAGALTEPGYKCEVIQMHDGKLPTEQHLTCDVALAMDTFSETADMAGISRVMGGYHIQADNIAGLQSGRKLAAWEWPKIKEYFNGTAKVRE
jgi:hypothetical protein